MTRTQPFGRDTDSTDTLTLDVEDRPRIERGDRLHVTPDVGRPYRATVLRIDGERVKVRIPGDGSHPVAPQPPQPRTFDAEELAGFYVRGDLLINPPDRPRP